jgi:hypothetical protein
MDDRQRRPWRGNDAQRQSDYVDGSVIDIKRERRTAIRFARREPNHQHRTLSLSDDPLGNGTQEDIRHPTTAATHDDQFRIHSSRKCTDLFRGRGTRGHYQVDVLARKQGLPKLTHLRGKRFCGIALGASLISQRENVRNDMQQRYPCVGGKREPLHTTKHSIGNWREIQRNKQ